MVSATPACSIVVLFGIALQSSASCSSSQSEKLFGGRFARSLKGKRRSGVSQKTESGRELAESVTTSGCSEEIANFFETDLVRYLPQPGDRVIYLKIVAAEGFDSW